MKKDPPKKALRAGPGEVPVKANTSQPDHMPSFPPRPRSCVWRQGRLNLRKLCDKNHRCAECPLDKALSESATKNRDARRQGKIPLAPDGRIAFTRERLQLLPKGERPCLLYANGLIDYKICCKNYECLFCEFDRYFSDQHQVHAIVRALDVLNVKGFRMPQGYYFHMGHTWVRIEEKADVSIGLDDFALRLLGPLDHIDTPLIGKTVSQGKPVIIIGRGSRKASVLSPVSGVVSTINLSVKENPVLAGEDPYARGWILKVHTDNLRQDLKKMLIGSESVKQLEQQIERLLREIEMTTGRSLSFSADVHDDVVRHLPDIGWERLVRLFFAA